MPSPKSPGAPSFRLNGEIICCWVSANAAVLLILVPPWMIRSFFPIDIRLEKHLKLLDSLLVSHSRAAALLHLVHLPLARLEHEPREYLKYWFGSPRFAQDLLEGIGESIRFSFIDIDVGQLHLGAVYRKSSESSLPPKLLWKSHFFPDPIQRISPSRDWNWAHFLLKGFRRGIRIADLDYRLRYIDAEARSENRQRKRKDNEGKRPSKAHKSHETAISSHVKSHMVSLLRFERCWMRPSCRLFVVMTVLPPSIPSRISTSPVCLSYFDIVPLGPH